MPQSSEGCRQVANFRSERWASESRLAFRTNDRTTNTTAIHTAVISFDEDNLIFSVSNEKVIATARYRLAQGKDIYSGPFWAPANSRLIYGLEQVSGYSRKYSLIRIKVDGSGPADLTGALSVPWLELIGWR